LSCGHVAGDVRGEYATLTQSFAFIPGTERDRAALLANGTMRCPRCGGPVYLDGTEPLRLRKRVEVSAADFNDPIEMAPSGMTGWHGGRRKRKAKGDRTAQNLTKSA
jgi:Zn-finger nucleic acid-binding protein